MRSHDFPVWAFAADTVCYAIISDITPISKRVGRYIHVVTNIKSHHKWYLSALLKIAVSIAGSGRYLGKHESLLTASAM